MKNKAPLAVLAGSMLVAVLAAAQALPRGRFVASPETGHERLQVLIDGQMATEAALVTAERTAVAAVRADSSRTEAQQQALVRSIREDYRERSFDMTARHAADKTAMTAEVL
jgi:hypothetical protein